MGLPALILENCRIDWLLDCNAMRFASLSLKGSKSRKVNLKDAEIQGTPNISFVNLFLSTNQSDSDAWIDARSSRIAGVVMSGASLNRRPDASPPRETFAMSAITNRSHK